MKKILAVVVALTMWVIQPVNAGLFSAYTKTKYPIVLVHGLMGFDSILGILDYWPEIPGALRDGGATVVVAQVSAVNSPPVRGEQLIAQLDKLRATKGYTKFNLIGHSLGSPTIRYVAGVRPDLVASVTAVGGSNNNPADAGLAARFGTDPNALIAKTFALVGSVIDWASGGGFPQDAAALGAWAVKGAEFNAKFPGGIPPRFPCNEGEASHNGIAYYSWSGVQPFTNFSDPSDYVFLITTRTAFESENDGAVGRCGSHLGRIIRDNYRFNHLDETNMFFGLGNPLEVSPVTLYRLHANRLKSAGL